MQSRIIKVFVAQLNELSVMKSDLTTNNHSQVALQGHHKLSTSAGVSLKWKRTSKSSWCPLSWGTILKCLSRH
jgi:hypothetical protein